MTVRFYDNKLHYWANSGGGPTFLLLQDSIRQLRPGRLPEKRCFEAEHYQIQLDGSLLNHR